MSFHSPPYSNVLEQYKEPNFKVNNQCWNSSNIFRLQTVFSKVALNKTSTTIAGAIFETQFFQLKTKFYLSWAGKNAVLKYLEKSLDLGIMGKKGNRKRVKKRQKISILSGNSINVDLGDLKWVILPLLVALLVVLFLN